MGLFGERKFYAVISGSIYYSGRRKNDIQYVRPSSSYHRNRTGFGILDGGNPRKSFKNIYFVLRPGGFAVFGRRRIPGLYQNQEVRARIKYGGIYFFKILLQA
ncbi:MAG: hypothetical protein ABFD66_01525 [Smithella sp.]